MFICTCEISYVCVCTYVNDCACAHMLTCTCSCVCVCMYMYGNVHVCRCKHVHTLCGSMCLFIHVFECINLCAELQLLSYQRWFKKMVQVWLRVALVRCKERIDKAVQMDQVCTSYNLYLLLMLLLCTYIKSIYCDHSTLSSIITTSGPHVRRNGLEIDCISSSLFSFVA